MEVCDSSTCGLYSDNLFNNCKGDTDIENCLGAVISSEGELVPKISLSRGSIRLDWEAITRARDRDENEVEEWINDRYSQLAIGEWMELLIARDKEITQVASTNAPPAEEKKSGRIIYF